MAVTQVDQNRLNKEGVQVVQKATSMWEDANKRGDTAGMKAAAEMAAAARANSAYQSVAGSSGYSTNASGYLYQNTPQVTQPQVTQPVQPTQQPVVQAPVVQQPDPVAQLVSTIVNAAQPRGYADRADAEGRGGSYVAPVVQQPVVQQPVQPVRDYATSPTQEGRGGSYVAPPVTSAPVNPYNANTNFENERRFLNNLIATGSAHDRLWAQGQLTLLEAEASKYAMAPNLEGRGGSFEQPAILPNTGSIYPIPDIPGVNTGVQPTNIYPLPSIPGITQPALPVDTGLGSGITNGISGGAGDRFTPPLVTTPVVDSSAPTYADRADAEGRGGSFEPVVPSTQRDIAAEIVALLTKGGPIDYDKLNLLVKERDAKLRSNPDLYGQFESTQSILDKYLYSAQNSENSTEADKPTSVTGNTDVVSSVIPGTPTDLTIPTTPITPITPTTPTVPVTPTTVTPTTNPEIDSLIAALRALSGPIQDTSYGDAKLRAEGELNPLYHDAAAELRRSLDLDMERRGIYNSPFAAGIMTEKQGKLTNQQISDVSRRANEIIQNDRTLSLQDRQLQSSTLSGLLSALIGRESNIADLTGYLNGQPTVANQVAQSNIKNNTLNGILNTIGITGKITTQEQADLLGLKIGDSTLQAKQAAEQLDLQVKQFEADKVYKQGSLANQQANTALANTAQQLEAAMAAWKSSGVAPNLPILQQYGIQPNTPFTNGGSLVEQKLAEAQAQLQLIAAEEELSFQTRASEYATSFKIPISTAEYLVFITDQSSDYNMALQTLMAKKNEIAADGVNITQLTEAIKQFYKVSSLSTGEPFTEVIHTET